MVLVCVGFIIQFVRLVLFQDLNWVEEQIRYDGQCSLLFHMVYCAFITCQSHLHHSLESHGMSAQGHHGDNFSHPVLPPYLVTAFPICIHLMASNAPEPASCGLEEVQPWVRVFQDSPECTALVVFGPQDHYHCRHCTHLEIITSLFRYYRIYLCTKPLAFPWTHSCHDPASQVLASCIQGFVCLISLLHRIIPDAVDGDDGTFHIWQYLLFWWWDAVPKVHSPVACWRDSYPSHILSPPGGSLCTTHIFSYVLLALFYCGTSVHDPSIWAFIPKGHVLTNRRSGRHFYCTCNLNLWTLLGSCQISKFFTSCKFCSYFVKWLLCSLWVCLGVCMFV